MSEEPVQRVPELMKHGSDVGEGQKRGPSWSGFGEIGNVVDHRLGTPQS